MTLQEAFCTGGGILAVVMTLIQIAPCKFDPWTALVRGVGRALNSEVLTKVDKLEQGLTAVQKNLEEQKAVTSRVRILRFGDECRQGIHHSKDYFDQTLSDITVYEKYCDTHQEFQNSITTLTCDFIKTLYRNELAKGEGGFK